MDYRTHRGRAAQQAPEKSIDLEELTIKEIRALAAERGIELPKRGRKALLIEAFRGSGD